MANYAAQLSPRLSAVERASAQQALAAACEPNGYSCRLLGAANLPATLLVVIGIGGILVALRTLNAIRRQADIMERQTAALIEGQRPIVFAKCHGDATKTFADQDARRIELTLENKGQHRARDLVYETWIEILPFPFTDFTSAATHFECTDPITLYPGDADFMVNIPIQRKITDEEWASVLSLNRYVCVRIRVSYRDAFGKTTADFGYYITPTGMAFLPKYNNTARYDDSD